MLKLSKLLSKSIKSKHFDTRKFGTVTKLVGTFGITTGLIGTTLITIKNIDDEYKHKLYIKNFFDETVLQEIDITEKCETGNKDIVLNLHNIDNVEWHIIFSSSLKCKSMDIAKWILDNKFIKIEDAMFIICKSGNEDMFNFFLNTFVDDCNWKEKSSGYNVCLYRFDQILRRAIYHAGCGKSINIINKLNEINEKLLYKWEHTDTILLSGLQSACRNGDIHLVKKMIEKINEKNISNVFIYDTDFHLLFYDSCSSGNIEVINYILSYINESYIGKYNKYDKRFITIVSKSECLKYVSESGNKKAVEHLLEKFNMI